ncbi:MAG: hypothetical protein SAJ72_21165, partial [Jaaginema sp. PMC 1080.18]|nr:hypothetical protein [Jaaginema sp. PMC 1080.18]
MNYRIISSFLVFFSAAMTFALPSKAGSIASVRVITTTNWYTCSTGKSLEWIYGYGNMSYTSLNYAAGCLNADGSARWLIQSGRECEAGYDCSQIMPDTYLNESYQATTGIYNRYMPTAVVGIDCTFDGDAGWTCQRLEGYQNTTLQTVGATELQSPGAFFRDNNVDH